MNTALRAEVARTEARYVEAQQGRAHAAEEARLLADEATKTALKSAMRSLQSLANEQLLVISRLQKKYGDSEILQDLLEIDHTNSQFGRRAQSIAVLCGGWSGRTPNVAPLYDVLRSAKGRIRHFKRVEIRSQSNYAVVSRVVEPLALAIAELLDNAASYSAPETSIEINIMQVSNGVCITIDDAGVGIDEEGKARAADLLAPQRPTGVTELGNPPQFGFAVIGVLAHHYGFTASVDTTSPYGGVRAVVRLPDELLTAMPEPEPTDAGAQPAEVRKTAGGLPKRQRRQVTPIAPRSRPAAGPAGQEPQTETPAAVMGAFQRGTHSGRVAVDEKEDVGEE
ncbi:MAG: ATP-binding protein [Thermocrispum sp.]